MVIDNIEELRAVRFKGTDPKYGEYHDIIYYSENDWKTKTPKDREDDALMRATNWKNKLEIDSLKEAPIIVEV